MRQISIIPAGLNPHEVLTNIAIQGNRFIFASTLAVYVYDELTLTIEKVITLADRTITSFALSPHDSNILVIGTLGGRLYVWDIEKQALINHLTFENFRVRSAIVQWDPHNPTRIIAFGEGEVKAHILLWNKCTEDDANGTIFRDVTSNSAKLVVLKINPQRANYLALGTSQGETILMEVGVVDKSRMGREARSHIAAEQKSSSMRTLPTTVKENTGAVVDLAWDGLSSIYLVVAYTNTMILWDTDTCERINVFDKSACANVTSVTWAEWIVGSFVTTTSKDNALKVWNASQKTPSDTIQIEGEGRSSGKLGTLGGQPGAGGGWEHGGRAGILQISRSARGHEGGLGMLGISINQESRHCICAHRDGSVSVFNLADKLLLFKSNAGHQETIFDCKVSPTDADTFATCSYDTTVKIWNAATFSLRKTLRGADSCLYSISWSASGRMIAASSSTGCICLWDVVTGSMRARYSHHGNAASFMVTWNQIHPNILCSSSSKCSLVIFQADESELLEVGVRTGNDAIQKESVAKGGHMVGSIKGGNYTRPSVNSEDVTPSNVKMRVVLPAPIFGVDFSPFKPNLVLAASQDGLVRVFDYYSKDPLVSVLRGHSSRVFHVKWSPLDPNMVASGSDDRNVIVWRVPIQFMGTHVEDGETVSNTPGEHLTNSSAPSARVDLTSRPPVVTMSSLITGTLTGGSILSPEATKRPSTQVPVFGPARVLQGHDSNVRALQWNYELQNVLLSGSWDATIRVWDVFGGVCLQKVVAHVADVYALAGHPNRPFSFISASRDTTLRMWEMGRVGALRGSFSQSVWENSLDTARSDRLDEPAAELSYSSGASIGNDTGNSGTSSTSTTPGEKEGKGDGADQGKRGTQRTRKSVMYRLSGERSSVLMKELVKEGGTGGRVRKPITKLETLQERMEAAQAFYRIFNFFCGGNGCLDVWEAALALLQAEAKGAPMDGSQILDSAVLIRPKECRQVLSPGEIAAGGQAEALRASPHRMPASAGNFSERAISQMRKAAATHARVGDLKRYCQIMIEMGDYTSALAMAPCVGMQYWQELAQQHATKLDSSGNELCAPYYMATGQPHRAANFYLGRRDSSNAMLVASAAGTPSAREGGEGDKTGATAAGLAPKSTSDQNLSSLDKAAPHDEYVGAGKSPQRAKSVSGTLSTVSTMYIGEEEVAFSGRDKKSSPLTRAVNAATADMLVQSGYPLFGAAQHLSCGMISDAIALLIGCDEYELAFALSVVFQLDSVKIRMLWAHQVQERYGNIALSLKILSSLPQEAEKEKCLLISSACSTQAELKEAFLLYGVRPIISWNTYASEQEILGNEVNTIPALVLTLQHSKAVVKGLACLKNYVRDPLELPVAVSAAYQSLKFVRAESLPEKTRYIFLMYMLWFSAHEAMAQGLRDTAADMLKILSKWAQTVKFPIFHGEIKMQETLFRVLAVHSFGDSVLQYKKADAMLAERLSEYRADAAGNMDVVVLLESLRKTLERKFLCRTAMSKSNIEENLSEQLRADLHVATGITSDAEIGGGLFAQELRDTMAKLSTLLSLPSIQRLPHYRPCTGGTSMLPGSMLPYFSASEGSSSDNETVPASAAVKSRVTGALAHSASNSRRSVISGDVIQRQSLTINSRLIVPPPETSVGAPIDPELPESSVEELIRLDEMGSSHRVRFDSLVGDTCTYASLNEIQGWRRVNSFSPTMSGEWLADVLEQHLI